MTAGKGISKTLVWILMGLLILGLGGFGITNLGGTVRSVGAVGETEIEVGTYARSLQNEIRAYEAQVGEPLSFAQAQAIGLDQRALATLISTAALNEETRILGISIGDGNLRDQIVGSGQFAGPDGVFDRDAYAFALDQIGMTERRYEEQVRSDSARTLLQAAVLAGVNAPAPYTDAMLSFLGEARDISWAVLDRNDLLTGVPVPDDADLVAYHAENSDDFLRPELKRITYAWLTPEMIVDTVEIDEAALRELYDARSDQYNRPERRLVEQLVFADQAEADAARAALDAGTSGFDDLVAARGLTLADTDLGDVSEDELGDAGEAVFAAESGSIAGPVPTLLGPALFRVNAVLQARVTTFEDALPDLRDELAMDRARRVIDAQIEPVDDLLAGGATVEDLASETQMQLGRIDWYSGLSEDIGAYEAFRVAAALLNEGEYPEVLELEESGGIYAMRLDEVLPPALPPLDEIRDQVETAWTDTAVQTALLAQATGQLEQLRGGASFEDLGLAAESVEGLTRQSELGAAPVEVLEPVFSMQPGEVRVIEGGGRVFLIRLDAARAPDPEDPELAQLRATLANQTAGSISQDLFQLLAEDIRIRVGITINDFALNAVHSNFQ